MINFNRILSKKELAEVKYQDTDEWIAQGGKITVLPEYKPEIKTLFGQNKNRNKPRKGIMK